MKPLLIACVLMLFCSVSTTLPSGTFRLKNYRGLIQNSALDLCIDITGRFCGGVAVARLKTCSTTSGTISQEFIRDTTHSGGAESINLKARNRLCLFRKSASKADDLSTKEYAVSDANNIHVTFTQAGTPDVWIISLDTDGNGALRYLIADTTGNQTPTDVQANNIVKWTSSDPSSDQLGQWVFDTSNVSN